MTKAITADSLIVRSSELVEASLGDEIIMMSIDQGKYYALNSVAVRLWERLKVPTPVAVLCAECLAEFEVSPEQCEADVLRFVQDLRDQGMVSVLE
jgi:hypothetical protein